MDRILGIGISLWVRDLRVGRNLGLIEQGGMEGIMLASRHHPRRHLGAHLARHPVTRYLHVRIGLLDCYLQGVARATGLKVTHSKHKALSIPISPNNSRLLVTQAISLPSHPSVARPPIDLHSGSLVIMSGAVYPASAPPQVLILTLPRSHKNLPKGRRTGFSTHLT